LARKLWLGVAGGLLAGTLVGLMEALYILTSGGATEYVALVYAAVLYGLIGGAMGVGVGLGLAVLSRLTEKLTDPAAYALGLLGVLGPLGIVIARYVANKAIYEESGVPLKGLLVILALFGLLGLLILWLVPAFLTRTPLKVVMEPRGTALAWGSLVGLSAVFSFAPGGSKGASLAPAKAWPADQGGAPNVVLIVSDTLRADHLGAYGHPGGLSPNLDALAKESVLFEQTITHASWTRASFASLYTSALPSRHKCATKASALPDDVTTIAEVLSEHGYATAGLPNNINVTASFNFQQGFDFFEYQQPSYIAGATESASQLSMYNVVRKLRDRVMGDYKVVTDYYQPADVVLGRAQEVISANRKAGNRFFLVVHLMEAHDPYFEHPYNGKAVGRAWYPNPKPEEAAKLRSMYEGEVKHLDSEVGRFFGWMKEQGAWDDTMVVFTADHGEEFYEHKGWWHGITLYDEQIHVPLIVKLPSAELAGARVPWQVRQMDISPTILARVGKAQPEIWQGADLLDEKTRGALVAMAAPPAPAVALQGAGPADGAPPADGSAAPPAPAAPDPRLGMARDAVSEQNFEGNELEAIRKNGWKYLRANEGNPRGLPTEELYRVEQDSKEQDNLAGKEPNVQVELGKDLRTHIEVAAGAGIQGAETEALSCEECQRLMALGYQDNCDAACGK
jgi:arylsulfatase A-like enzyme